QAHRAPGARGHGHARGRARRHRAAGLGTPPTIIAGVHAQAALPGREGRGRGSRLAVRRRPRRPAGTADAGSHLMSGDASIGERIDAAVAAVDDVLDAARGELEALVRIPSISADPEHHADVRASADATVELLRAHGLE